MDKYINTLIFFTTSLISIILVMKDAGLALCWYIITPVAICHYLTKDNTYGYISLFQKIKAAFTMYIFSLMSSVDHIEDELDSGAEILLRAFRRYAMSLFVLLPIVVREHFFYDVALPVYDDLEVPIKIIAAIIPMVVLEYYLRACKIDAHDFFVSYPCKSWSPDSHGSFDTNQRQIKRHLKLLNSLITKEHSISFWQKKYVELKQDTDKLLANTDLSAYDIEEGYVKKIYYFIHPPSKAIEKHGPSKLPIQITDIFYFFDTVLRYKKLYEQQPELNPK